MMTNNVRMGVWSRILTRCEVGMLIGKEVAFQEWWE